jgi:hypothetical protein
MYPMTYSAHELPGAGIDTYQRLISTKGGKVTSDLVTAVAVTVGHESGSYAS